MTYAYGGPTGQELAPRFILEGASLLAPGGTMIVACLDLTYDDGRRPFAECARQSKNAVSQRLSSGRGSPKSRDVSPSTYGTAAYRPPPSSATSSSSTTSEPFPGRRRCGWRQPLPARSEAGQGLYPLGLHDDSPAGALCCAQAAALAVVEVERVAPAGAPTGPRRCTLAGGLGPIAIAPAGYHRGRCRECRLSPSASCARVPTGGSPPTDRARSRPCTL